ncbi:MAG: branched-chain amino acid ABC transporter permease [Actinomycetota bacterium]|jgi:branched-chain amino acid transport system permease protein|nr:branched-chain amino acid ABC transporter permease [Actinomycetota bacterium]
MSTTESAVDPYADPTTPPLWRRSVVVVVLALIVVWVPFNSTPTYTTDFTQLVALTLSFAGLSVLTHHLGLLSLGHGALTGLGSVAALHSVNDFGLPPTLMPLAGLAAGFVAGAIVAIPSLRLPKAYLALLTLSMAVAFPIVLRQIDGPLPVTLEAEFLPPSWTSIAERDEHIWEFAIVVAWTVVALFLVYRLLRGPVGRAFIASRDDPQAAAAFGIPVRRIRLFGVALSGGLAGLGGSLLVVAVNFTDAPLYPESLSIKMFAVAMAFGGHRLVTVVPASTFLVLLPVWLDDRTGWVAQPGWIGLLKSEGFIYAVLLLVTAHLTQGRGFAHLLEERKTARRLGLPRQPLIRSRQVSID